MSETETVNGKPCMKGWGEKVTEAQGLKRIKIGNKIYKRVPCGSHQCGDCAVIHGQLHVPGCDMERCPKCRGQILSCDCDIVGDIIEAQKGVLKETGAIKSRMLVEVDVEVTLDTDAERAVEDPEIEKVVENLTVSFGCNVPLPKGIKIGAAKIKTAEAICSVRV